MVEYRLEDERTDKNIIELRFVTDVGEPTLQGRSSGKNWVTILWFSSEGRLYLSKSIAGIKGLVVSKNGKIEIDET